MARRRRAEKRKITPDPRFKNIELAQFINKVMLNGKKTTSQRIVYGALDQASEEARRPVKWLFATQCRWLKSSPEGLAARRIRSQLKSGPSDGWRWQCDGLSSRRGHGPGVRWRTGCRQNCLKLLAARERRSNDAKTFTEWPRLTEPLPIIAGSL